MSILTPLTEGVDPRPSIDDVGERVIQPLLPDFMRKYSVRVRLTYDPSVHRWHLGIESATGRTQLTVADQMDFRDDFTAEKLTAKLDTLYADHVKATQPRQASAMPDLPKPFRMPPADRPKPPGGIDPMLDTPSEPAAQPDASKDANGWA